MVGSGYWRLRKGVYGLKQAGRQWYLELNSKLESLGINRLQSDWSVYLRNSDFGRSLLTTSVDDMLIASTSDAESDTVVYALQSIFEITDNGEPTLHLGCGITRDRTNGTLKLDQHSYILSILREFGFENSNSVHTPMNPKVRLSPPSSSLSQQDIDIIQKFPYCAVVGKSQRYSTG